MPSGFLLLVDAIVDRFNLGGRTQLFAILAIAFTVVFAATSIINGRNELRSLRAEIEIRDYNNNVLEDSLRIEQNKAGEFVSVREAFQLEVDRLEQYSQELFDELEKEKGNVKTITRTEIVTVRDTVDLSNEIVRVGNAYTFRWSLEDMYSPGNFRKLGGHTTFNWDGVEVGSNKTSITRDEIGMRLISGFRETDDGKLETFVRTDYPGVTFDVQGASLDPNAFATKPEPKRWGIGPLVAYDALNQRVTVGVGLQRNFIRFNL